MAAGATVTTPYTLTVVNPLPANTTQVANLAASSNGTCSDCNPTNPTVAVLDTVKTIATVNGAAATSATAVKAGDVVVYDIVTTNTGGSAGSTTLSDPVPANTTYTGTGEGWSCAGGSAAGTACTQSVTVAAGASVTKPYTLTVVDPIPANVTTVANLVASSTGTCSDCHPTNPVIGALNTVKTIATVNGTAATASTQVKAGDVIAYNIVTGNTAARTPPPRCPIRCRPTLSTPVSGEGWSCASGAAAGTACTQDVTVAAGASVTKSYTLTVVDPLPANTLTVANLVASSTGTCTDCNPINPVGPKLDTVKQIGTVNGSAATLPLR